MFVVLGKKGWAVACCLVFCTPLVAAPPSDTLTLNLRPTVAMSKAQVSVGDVATLEGGPAHLRQWVGQLDLGELSLTAPTLEITGEQIAFRLRLAGVENGQFKLQGAARTSVRLTSRTVTDHDVLAAATEAVLKRLPAPKEEVAIQLSQPIQKPLTLPGDAETYRLEGEVAPGSPALGRVRVDVTLFANGERQSYVTVHLEVKPYRRVALTTKPIEPGEPLTPDKVRFERRAVDAALHHVTDQEDLSARRASRSLAAGQAITKEDIEAAAPDNPVVVKQRDLVRLIVRIDHLQVTALGEVIQDGRAGQLVRVRNIDSKNIVIGRVIDHTTIEVEQGGIQP